MSWRINEVYREEVDVFPERIVGKQRPRHTRGGHEYTPDCTRRFEAEIREQYIIHRHRDMSRFTGAVSVRVIVWRELARSNPRYWMGRSDTGKPDADNVLKGILDSLNGVAWKDDQQIIECSVTKAPRPPHGSGNRIRIRVRYYQEEH